VLLHHSDVNSSRSPTALGSALYKLRGRNSHSSQIAAHATRIVPLVYAEFSTEKSRIARTIDAALPSSRDVWLTVCSVGGTPNLEVVDHR
jgi:hypothetical protein